MSKTLPENTALSALINQAQVLATRRERLGVLVHALNKGIEALKADSLPEIRAAIEEASAAWVTLELGLKDHPELFVRPRSLEAHGIKFGYAKSKGGLDIADPDATVQRINRLFPDRADVLTVTKTSPSKDALAQLPASDLKRLGVEVRGTGDTIFIKPAEGAVDKLVRALVTSAVEEASPD